MIGAVHGAVALFAVDGAAAREEEALHVRHHVRLEISLVVGERLLAQVALEALRAERGIALDSRFGRMNNCEESYLQALDGLESIREELLEAERDMACGGLRIELLQRLVEHVEMVFHLLRFAVLLQRVARTRRAACAFPPGLGCAIPRG